jgi:hypothetical protein
VKSGTGRGSLVEPRRGIPRRGPPQVYRAAGELGADEGDLAVGELGEALAPYHRALDLPIVRVLADEDASLLCAVADAAAP